MSEGLILAFLSLAALAVIALSWMDEFTWKVKQTVRLPLQVLFPIIKFDAILASALACDLGHRVIHGFKTQVLIQFLHPFLNHFYAVWHIF